LTGWMQRHGFSFDIRAYRVEDEAAVIAQ
jgi:hypothetical protein